jgi:hypothetical protein
MPANYVLLDRIELNATASSITFDNIPQTGYTDLKVVMSARDNRSGYAINSASIAFNTGGTYSGRQLNAYNLTTVASSTGSSWSVPSPVDTANVFSSAEIYIPNYTSNSAKSFSIDNAVEGNSSYNALDLIAGLWSGTAAITSITITPSGSASFVANSTFSLYGLAAVGTTPAIAPKASGGNVIGTDGTYWYHAFLSNGTFTPQTNLTADVLVVAGGGGGGSGWGGGGGAGGLLTFTSQSMTPIAYTCTVGAGGAAGTRGVSGAGSQFAALTATVAGGGGAGAGVGAAFSGGSGGGGTYDNTAGAAGTSGQGFAGGAGDSNVSGGNARGGGGGGAGAVGGAAVPNTVAGAGGIGATSSFINSIGAAVGIGQLSSSNYYFAGGGGGGGANGGTAQGGAAGIGGGGIGAGNVVAGSGTANTGGGGGGAGGAGGTSGAGGSGIVVIRYLVA